jgi:hypothetical protein
VKQQNKEKALILFREIIVTQTNHWSLFALSYGLSVMLSEVYAIMRLSLVCWGIMGLGLVANYLIRIKTRKMIVSIGLHLLTFIGMSLTGFYEFEYLLLHAGFAFFYCVLSIVKQHGGLEQEDEPFPIPVISILICAPFFILTLQQYDNITNIY